jgi:hypothetical protein
MGLRYRRRRRQAFESVVVISTSTTLLADGAASPPRRVSLLVSGKQGFAAHGCRQTITCKQGLQCGRGHYHTSRSITGGVKNFADHVFDGRKLSMFSVSTRTLVWRRWCYLYWQLALVLGPIGSPRLCERCDCWYGCYSVLPVQSQHQGRRSKKDSKDKWKKYRQSPSCLDVGE